MCRWNRFLLALVLGGSLGLSAPAGAQDVRDGCSAVSQTSFVHDTLRDIYFWYRELPNVNYVFFDSPEALLEAVRFRRLDATFSYITTRQASDAFFSASQFIGFGFSSKQTGAREIRVSQVFPESPASEAGLARGDFLLAVGGRPVGELIASGELGAALGPSEIGLTVELTWRSLDGRERTARLAKRLVTIPTVSQAAVLDLDGLPVGYLHLRNFVEPSVAALDRTFAEFRARGVVDLVLDLRYNGGGLIDVARHLGGLIGGSRTFQQIFVQLKHNDKHPELDRAIFFEDPAETLDLTRIVVITTPASASASELVVNGLKPFVPVTVVGDRTFGKPVGQYGFEFCDKVLFPVSFENQNANGDGDFYGGIAPDCAAGDELDRALGDPSEASLAEALHFLREGACSPRSQGEAGRALRVEAPRDELFGFRRLVGAW